ncbi:ComEC/Rec2 family competence protein [Parachlamydia sp. AcF125]|uniref:ComEC/Rec2 family competence protein n=1 Tax=Parachlamydia sp. AcF125 TaxID=2795736 RepID=UPI001BC9A41D|nr:ComEC/Rec2 family competence protein [Parachlamydia sp. AcF125]MBS4167998.1 ComE operon protein 3 [Parachlamydia sp. AcF125]
MNYSWASSRGAFEQSFVRFISKQRNAISKGAYALSENCERFWRFHPALLYGFSMMLGIQAALFKGAILFLPFFVLWLPLVITPLERFLQLKIRLILALGMVIGAYLYAHTIYLYPQVPSEGIQGIACIDISSVKSVKSFQGQSWKYTGTMRSFIPADEQASIARNVPYTLFFSQHCDAASSYLVEGILKEWRPGYYILKLKKDETWHPLPYTWSMAELRYSWKQKLFQYILKQIPQKRSARFLAGIVTGEFDDSQLSFEFSRFGLQHIMAISGFHFAIIASILGFFLKQVFSKNGQIFILLILLTGYFIFLGPACSIMRAWITISISLLGCLLNKRAFGLNSLGIALMIMLLFNPLSYRSLAFQFSILTTGSILLFMPLILPLIEKIWKKRPLKEAIRMSLTDQHGYVILSMFRETLALCLAVNLSALPLILFYFHKFPLLSLVYNLFFPFLVSMAMFLLIISMCIGCIWPYAAQLLYTVTSEYTALMLDFTFNMPTCMDYFLRVRYFPLEILVGYLMVLLIVGILFSPKTQSTSPYFT